MNKSLFEAPWIWSRESAREACGAFLSLFNLYRTTSLMQDDEYSRRSSTKNTVPHGIASLFVLLHIAVAAYFAFYNIYSNQYAPFSMQRTDVQHSVVAMCGSNHTCYIAPDESCNGATAGNTTDIYEAITLHYGENTTLTSDCAWLAEIVAADDIDVRSNALSVFDPHNSQLHTFPYLQRFIQQSVRLVYTRNEVAQPYSESWTIESQNLLATYEPCERYRGSVDMVCGAYQIEVAPDAYVIPSQGVLYAAIAMTTTVSLSGAYYIFWGIALNFLLELWNSRSRAYRIAQ